MRVMVLMKTTEDSERGLLPTTEAFEAMGRFNKELADAGIIRAADGLKSSSHGKHIAFDGPDRPSSTSASGDFCLCISH